MSSAVAARIGRIGIWSAELRSGGDAEVAEAAAELDELGYGALWIPGEMKPDMPADLDRLLAATRTRQLPAASSISGWTRLLKSVPGGARFRRSMPSACCWVWASATAQPSAKPIASR